METPLPLQQLRQSNIRRKKPFPWQTLLSLTEHNLFKQEVALVLLDMTPGAWITVLRVSQSPSCPKECLSKILINCFDFQVIPIICLTTALWHFISTVSASKDLRIKLSRARISSTNRTFTSSVFLKSASPQKQRGTQLHLVCFPLLH